MRAGLHREIGAGEIGQGGDLAPGFVQQEQSLPIQDPHVLDAMAAELMAAELAQAYPHVAELVAEHASQPGYSYGQEFEVGLPLMLDGLEALRRHGARRRSSGTAR